MFRNLFHIVRRFKVASSLNLIGLSLAFASFIVIMMQVEYEINYNKGIKDHERVYRLELSMSGQTIAVHSRPAVDALRQVTEVEAIAESFPIHTKGNFSIEDGGEETTHILENVIQVAPEYTQVFSFDMIEGDIKALKVPMTLFIPKSLADAFFPNTSPVGKILKDEQSAIYTIGGVYKDFPKNVTPKNIIYQGLDDKVDKNNAGAQNYNVFIKLKNPDAAGDIPRKAMELTDDQRLFFGNTKEEALKVINDILALNPIVDTYFSENVKYDFGEKGSKTNTYLLICIAFLILIIAAINFVNFSTALAPMRIKSINTKKVLGSTNEKLRTLLISEAGLTSFTGFLLSLFIVYLSKGTFISELIAAEMELGEHIGLIIAVGGISIITGVVAGLYPSFYLTSFAPALVLKGSFGLSPKGRKLRSALLALQFTASIVLLSVSAFMTLQNRFLVKRDYGYETENILSAEFNGSHKGQLITMLKSNENILDIAFTLSKVSCDDNIPRWGTTFKGTDYNYDCITFEGNLPKTLGLKIIEGRNMTEVDLEGNSWVYLLNKKAQEEMDVSPGDTFNGGKVVGIFDDFQYTTFRKVPGPLALLFQGDELTFSKINKGVYNNTYIRIAPGYPLHEAITFVEKTIKKIDPYSNCMVEPYDNQIKNAYRAERNISKMILLFSFIAIILSVIGVFGLVTFETTYKRKEIGVRKVFGSSSVAILHKLSSHYIKMIGISSLVAVPIAWYIVYRWLENFTLRTPIYWWVFLLAVLAVSLITLMTVTYQNFVASQANPVESLKGE